MPRKKVQKWSNEIKQSICDQIKLGKTLVSICKQPGYPAYSTVLEWPDKDPAFKQMYNSARIASVYFKIDKLKELADVAKSINPKDTAERIKSNDPTMIKIAMNTELQAIRLEADILKFEVAKIAAKLHPEVFGDHITVDHQGGLNNTISVINYADLVHDEAISVGNKPDKVQEH